MQTFMREVVEDGTGERLLGQSYAASGKTGTAEFSTSSKASHAWFVGYAHREDKEDIAVAVIVEDSGSGSEYAVPIAKKIFDAYYQYWLHEKTKSIILITKNHIRRYCNDRGNKLWWCGNIPG